MLILRPPGEPLLPTRGAEDWKAFLADPDKHWKDGRSAKMLAEAWEGAAPDLPREIRAALMHTAFESFRPSVAIPEFRVELPGGGRASQNDLYVLGRIGRDLAVMMVEGKVDESFGPLLEEWQRDASEGKRERLAFLTSTLGIETELPGSVRYQLLHRTASPLIEAMRIGARYAAMVVHSFSPADAWHEDYRALARLMGVDGGKGRLERVPRHTGVELWMGWVTAPSKVPTAEQLLAFAAGLEGERLATQVRGAGFAVRVVAHCLEITPESSGEFRTVHLDRIQAVLGQYERSGSMRTADYQGITFDASYLLVLIARYLNDDGRDPQGVSESALGPRFDAALTLASELHRTDLRKGSSVPYVSHLMSVAALVLEDGGDEEEALAALLHDALEDHPEQISVDDIEATFGSRVRDLVLACTDTPPSFAGGTKPAWKERKDAYLAHIRSGEVPWRVSLADKLHNARSILRDHRLLGDAVWERFTASKDHTLWYYKSLAEAYRAAGADGFMIDELERVLEDLVARAR